MAHLYVPTGIHLPLDPLNEALSYVTTKLWPDGKFVQGVVTAIGAIVTAATGVKIF